MTSPTQYTAEDIIQVVKGSKGVISAIATRLGVTRKTVYNYIDRYATVKQAIADERESMKDYAEGKLYQHIKEDNLTALIFYLKTQASDRGYVERLRIEGNINLTVINDTIRALTDAGLDPAETFQEMINELAHATNATDTEDPR